MIPSDLEPLDDDLADLLDAERARPPAAPEVHARLLGRVMTTVGGGGGGGAPPAPSTRAAPPAPAAGSSALLIKPILIGAALGGLVSAVVLTRPDPMPVPRAVATASVAMGAVTAAPSPCVVPAMTARPQPEPPASPAAPAPVAPTSASAAVHETGLSAERLLLEEAQHSISAGHSAAALGTLERHAREFPRGQLGQEREALWIRALVRAGRVDEARARATRFREAFPRSILLQAIESSVGAIP